MVVYASFEGCVREGSSQLLGAGWGFFIHRSGDLYFLLFLSMKGVEITSQSPL